jgi:hypothetical protein
MPTRTAGNRRLAEAADSSTDQKEQHMWVFISARLRAWVIFAVIVPVATTAVHLLRRRLESRSGRTPLVIALNKIENLGARASR